MEIENQIKKYRNLLSLSQEELGEKVYVTRQTISNWENGRSYPDINSLILLSSTFEISIDELIQGDLEEMREIINGETIKRFKKIGNLYGVFFLIMLLSIGPLFYFFSWRGIIIWGIIAIIALIFAVKVDKLKKENDIYTIKEIEAFMEGKKLDEIDEAKEDGKRYYQITILAFISGIIGLISFLIPYLFLKKFFG